MLRDIFFYFATIFAIRIILHPYQFSLGDSAGESLAHGLSFTNKRNSEIVWMLEYNEGRYRIRYSRFFLTSGSNDELVKMDGGAALEEYDELVKIEELKSIVKQQKQPEEKVEIKKECGSEKTPKKDIKEPIRENNSKLASELIEDADMDMDYYSNLIGGEPGSSSMKSAFSDGNETGSSNKKKDAAAAEYLESEKEEEKKSELQSSALYEDKDEKKKKEPGTKIGYHFELIPVFGSVSEHDKIVIMKGKQCLTKKLKFKKCAFEQLSSLEKDFYWSIEKITDIEKYNDMIEAIEKRKEEVEQDKGKATNTDAKKSSKDAKAPVKEESSSSDSSSTSEIQFTPQQNSAFQSQYDNVKTAILSQNPDSSPVLSVTGPIASDGNIAFTGSLWKAMVDTASR